MRLITGCLGLLMLTMAATACQSPTSASSISYDDAIDATPSPNPIVAEASTDGRTYRIVRGNNQPDEIATYDWHAVFATIVTFNANATNQDVDVAFPVRLSSATLVVKQASGGIITPPTGSDKEYYEFVTLTASNNQFSGVSASSTLTFEAWYDLPSLRKEAVVTVTFSFVDDDSKTFQKIVDIKVAP
jgi:hypothetical protein